MDEQRPVVVVPFSRRQFLSGAVTLAGAALLAACGSGKGETGAATTAPKPSGHDRTGTRLRDDRSVPPVPPVRRRPQRLPTTPQPDLTIVSGKFNVWFSANWNTVTDEAVGNTFVDWGKQNNIKVEWQSIPGSPIILQKEAAAVAAGQPPELDNNNMIYWYTQGEMGDLGATVNKFKGMAGGMFPIGISSLTAPDGVDHRRAVRDRCLARALADRPDRREDRRQVLRSYDQLIDLGPQIQQPPKNYTYAMALGHEGDHVNNLVTALGLRRSPQ